MKSFRRKTEECTIGTVPPSCRRNPEAWSVMLAVWTEPEYARAYINGCRWSHQSTDCTTAEERQSHLQHFRKSLLE